MPSDKMCQLCGEPMPTGEEMFFFHGYSGPCPSNPPKESAVPSDERKDCDSDKHYMTVAGECVKCGKHWDQLTTEESSRAALHVPLKLRTTPTSIDATFDGGPLTANADAATIRARFAELLDNMPAHYDEPGIWDEASVAVVLVREALAAPRASVEASGSEESFVRDLAAVINRHSREGNSGTPDFILAEFASTVLDAYASAVRARNQWHTPARPVEGGQAAEALAALRRWHGIGSNPAVVEWIDTLASALAAPPAPEVSEDMVKAFLEALRGMGYGPIRHADARIALTAALRGGAR